LENLKLKPVYRTGDGLRLGYQLFLKERPLNPLPSGVFASKSDTSQPFSRTESENNERFRASLQRNFPNRTTDILNAAEGLFFEQSGASGGNRPELYELVEGGYVDGAIEKLGEKRWIIGRPKIESS
jgi:hypothetical protein